MLKFSVQTFHQPLFSHSFPFRNSFPSQKLPTPNSPKQKPKGKTQAKAKCKKQKPQALLQQAFYKQWQTG
jgi:hypothetical protein